MREQLDIEVIKNEVQRIRMTEATWTTIDPEDRVAFRAEWRDLVDIFGHLVAAYDAGRLPANLQSDLIGLSVRLVELAPTLERLRLRQPDPKTLARLRLAAAS
jgi:hypothetical protein